MKLVGTAALLCTVAVAHAETSLSEDNSVQGSAPSAQLFEAACDLDIDLKGALAQVEVRQRIVNPGPDEMAALYEFDLPEGAAITSFTLRADGAAQTALPISGTFNTVNVEDRPVLGSDPALLFTQPSGPRYAVRLQPIAASREVLMTTRFVMPARVHASALRLVLPGRGTTGKLTACRGTIRAAAGPGATIAGFRIGSATTARASTSFVLDTKDVAIDAMLSFAGKEPIVWTQTEPLVDGWSATMLTVAAPPVRTTTAQARRALFVIDGSRSMELVGSANVAKVIGTLAGALPANVEVEGIIFDRTAKRVFGAWKPDSPATIAELKTAVTKRVAQNGSSLTSAFELAHASITDGTRAQTMVIVISDGVLGDVAGSELIKSLDMTTSTVDVIAVVLNPAETRSPDVAVIRSPVNLYGGSLVEISIDELDDALQVVDEWLRPSWLDLAVGDLDIPSTVRAGSGFTRTLMHKGAASKLVLTGHGESLLKIAPRTAPSAPVAAVALAAIRADQVPFTTDPDPDDDERDRSLGLLTKAMARHKFARDNVSYAVLTTQGRIARNRIAMVKGGGPYERIVTYDDPGNRPGLTQAAAPTISIGRIAATASAISKPTLERLFRDQLQPKAFACYQRALGTDPKLNGTVLFQLRMGRGEVTQVALAGTTNQGFEDCLRDAAYALSVPFPDFSINADDQTIAHYPLTFNVNEAKPVIVLGDADSTSPLDIDAIQGGVPVKPRGPVQPNAASPLGNLRPSKQP